MFIVLEGGEGSGKSTLAAGLALRARGTGREVVLTREPGGTPAGEQVRALLHEPLTPWAETFAFLTARAQLVHEVIRPALARGAIVICDRFEASTFAYQGHGRGLDLRALQAANRLATGGLHPDVTLYLDIDPATGLARKLGEEEAIRTGLETLEFHRRVRKGYLAQAASSAPGAWLTIDATQPPSRVQDDAWAWIEPLFGTPA
jgi:dTMP kinase